MGNEGLICFVHEVGYRVGYGDGGLALAGAPSVMFGAPFAELFYVNPQFESERPAVTMAWYVAYERGFQDGYDDMFLEVLSKGRG